MATTKAEKDRMLLLRARAGENDSLEKLLDSFKPMVNSIARGYFLSSGDFEDLVQEGMIGLHKAFLTYDLNNAASFATFAHLCINRQVQSAIRKSKTNKNLPLKNYLSIDSHGMLVLGQNDDDNENFGIYIESDSPSPEDYLVMRETCDELNEKIKQKLSVLEFNVLALYLKGYNYQVIANKLGKDAKAVDNAIERIKAKLQFLRG